MVKSILFLFNLLGLLIFGIIQKGEVELDQNVPATLKPGREAVVEVQINKSDVSGFAKLQITLGDGLIIEPVETAGASFTFNDQKAKFIWMALPSDKKFTLKYRLIADKNAVGQPALDTRFSYIYNNERKNFDLPQHIIAVGDEGAVSANVLNKAAADEAAKNNAATASLNRNITSTGINQWRVDISLTKTNLEGFAKIEETIPDGYTVIDLKSSSAVFSMDDSHVKYIWYDLPNNETVEVSYKMLPVKALEGTEPKISGNFSYLKNDETVTIPIGIVLEEEPDMFVQENDTFKINTSESEETNQDELTKALAENVVSNQKILQEDQLAVEETPDETMPAEVPENVRDQTTSSQKQAYVKDQSAALVTTQPKPTSTVTSPIGTASTRSYTDGNIVDVPQPEKGIFYRVQIAAGKNNLKQEVFNVLYAFAEGFKLENQNGLFKYTTGYHQVYKQARDDRERITGKYAKFKGPFVTAYNDGDRITVQEALMITSQKWYQ